MDMFTGTPVGRAVYFENGVVLERITTEDVGYLRWLLFHSKSKDTYVRSPLYFAFTGRNGLLHVRVGGIEFIACIHPNDIATLLLFIPFVDNKDCFQNYLDVLTYTLEKASSRDFIVSLLRLIMFI